MFSLHKHFYICVIILVLNSKSCTCEAVTPVTLTLYSAGEPEYADVVVRRARDNLTLACELRGDPTPRLYVWNYVADNHTRPSPDRPFTIEPAGPATRSTLVVTSLQASDSGRYMCSVPPFSVSKYILVQSRGPVQCARGAFWCGARCVLASYVCDGRRDCLHGEDEDVAMCDANICARPDKLNCSTGRCISEAACCRGGAALCRQPACCDEFTRRGDLDGYAELDYPPLFEDRHAPDDYGFIQSTIYTVTACALIFMIAVVLLVSAICKMQMKRAALRGYTHADRATARHYSVQYHQTHRFPPCYEASRLLEQEGRPPSPLRSPLHLPTAPMDLQCSADPPASPRGLARLSAIFSSRYREVPLHPADVELTLVAPLETGRVALPSYRSPAGGAACEQGGAAERAVELNCTRQDTLDRVMDQLDRQRLTLQLGRFQLQLPRWRGAARPDTPDVPPAALDPRGTYTLNGRTIRLLGADIQHYPAPACPPSYTEAVRYKLYGPPPEYLSRERLNRSSADRVDDEADTNVEMPPCYEDLTANGTVAVSSGTNNVINGENDVANGENDVANGNDNVASGASNVVNGNGIAGGNSDAVTGNCNIASGNNLVYSDNKVVIGNSDVTNGNSDVTNGNRDRNETHMLETASAVINDNDNANGNIYISAIITGTLPVHNVLQRNECNARIETLSSIIDNLPAIDSDVNANDAETGANNDHVIRDNVIRNGDVNSVIKNV